MQFILQLKSYGRSNRYDFTIGSNYISQRSQHEATGRFNTSAKKFKAAYFSALRSSILRQPTDSLSFIEIIKIILEAVIQEQQELFICCFLLKL